MRVRGYVGTLIRIGSISQRGGNKATSFREERRKALARESLVENGAYVSTSHWSMSSFALLTYGIKRFCCFDQFKANNLRKNMEYWL